MLQTGSNVCAILYCTDHITLELRILFRCVIQVGRDPCNIEIMLVGECMGQKQLSLFFRGRL